MSVTGSPVCYACRVLKPVCYSLLYIFCGLVAATACAQESQPVLYTDPLKVASLLANTHTTPDDDAVLAVAPTTLQFQFPEQVRLVKLTLHNQSRNWVDIDFRYDPAPVIRFSWPLPRLQGAAYYTADWAVLMDDEQLVRGSFSFAFGPEAEVPSQVRAAQELLLEQRNGNFDPEVRTVNSPPTRIIINQEPRQYDPPFTIDLDNGDGPNP